MCRWICKFFLTWEAKLWVASKCWSPAKLHKKKAPKTGREKGTRGQDQHVSNQTVGKWWATKRWWSWMKLLAEFSRPKVSWKCQKPSWKVSSEMMRHAPCAWKLIWKNPKITLVRHLFKSSSENGNSERQNQRVESLQNCGVRAKQKNNIKGAWASKNLDPKVKLQQAFVLEENASLEAPPNLLTEFVEVGP